MNESTAWLRHPSAADALPAVVTEVIRGARVLLNHPDMGNVAKLTALEAMFNDVAPAPPPDDPAAVASALQGQGAEGLARALRSCTCPLTSLMVKITSEPVEVDVWHRVTRRAGGREVAHFGVEPGTLVCERHARMTVGNGRTGAAADVHSIVVTSRLDPDAAKELNGSTSLGAVLTRGYRQPHGASAWSGTVYSEATMWDGKLPVAWVDETIYPWVGSLLEKQPQA